MVRFHILVHGQVQGVGFRYFVRQNASLYGINGWVRNNFDSTVEIDAEGSQINMEAFIDAVKRGNSYSSVERVDVDQMQNLKNYKSFNIEG